MEQQLVDVINLDGNTLDEIFIAHKDPATFKATVLALPKVLLSQVLELEEVVEYKRQLDELNSPKDIGDIKIPLTDKAVVRILAEEIDKMDLSLIAKVALSSYMAQVIITATEQMLVGFGKDKIMSMVTNRLDALKHPGHQRMREDENN